MKKIIFITILLSFVFISGSGQNSRSCKFYVGTFTSEGAKGIYLCLFNNKTGEITLNATFEGMSNPSFLKISPDRNTLYVVTRMPSQQNKSDGFVEAWHIKNDGRLKFINKRDSHGSGPCHVDVSHDGNFVAIATYGGGTTSLYPLTAEGVIMPATSTIINSGSGPDKSRQSAPHAHSIRFGPSGNKVYSADLGTDQLNIFNMENNKLVPAKQKHVKLSPGAGPRHFDFHPGKKVIYIINELNSTITALKNRKGTWKKFQTVSTLPPGYTETSYCADIHVSSNGRFLYGSNRGHNSIAIFEIDDGSQELKWKGTVSCRGDWPRNFALSPDGNFLLVANQKSHNITVFKIDENTGMPEYTNNEINLSAPVCIEFY